MHYLPLIIYNRSQVGNLLTNYRTETEANAFLDTKQNINNPQDMSGVLRIGHVLGTSTIILNALASDRFIFLCQW